MRRDAVFCGRECKQYHKRERRRVEARLRRPRCIICDSPINYGKPGVNFKSTTCGRRQCAVAKWNWFVRKDR